jgi:hypothetical protein
MPEFPFVSGGVVRGAGATAGTSSAATTLTAAGSANTKGTAVQLIAATEFDASWILVQLSNVSSTASYLVDILIGAATEQVIIPNLYAISKPGGNASPYLFPLFVPKGSRLSARCQASTASATIEINIVLVAGTMIAGGSAPSWVTEYGAVALSIGTNIDPGAVADTDSAWVEITAATTMPHNWLAIAARFSDIILAASTKWRLNIGIGAATEQVLIPDLHFSAETGNDVPANSVAFLPVFIPAGSRLTAKVRSSVTTDGDRDIWLKLYGAG